MASRESSERFASLRRAADRAATQQSFMAYLLARWGEAKGLKWDEAAEVLGCTDESVHRLALCLRPNPSLGSFAEDVERIASYARIDPGALARVVREVDAVQALRETRPLDDANATVAGILMAALDRLEGEQLDDPSDEDGS